MKIARIVIFVAYCLAFASIGSMSATLWQAWIKDIARDVAREEINRHFGESP